MQRKGKEKNRRKKPVELEPGDDHWRYGQFLILFGVNISLLINDSLPEACDRIFYAKNPHICDG